MPCKHRSPTTELRLRQSGMTEKIQMTDHQNREPAKSYPLDLLKVESLDIEAQGIAHHADGKLVFIEGALPYEVVTANAKPIRINSS